MSRQQPSSPLIEALLRPEAYPHDVAGPKLVETHISWVILTGCYAYKIKKPVDLGFLDFSSLERRHHFCEEEVRLNRRFSTSLYVGVVAIAGTPQSPQVDGTGEAIEYAVKMREFSQDCLLENHLADGRFDTALVEMLGARLATFHDQADRCDADGGTPAYGSLKAVKAPALENFEQIRVALEEAEQREVPGAQRQLQHLQGWCEQALVDLEMVFKQRREGGFIRECHGDLHLRNILVIAREIQFFDCIEFDDQLRWIDTFSELGFLLMDLEVRGHGDWANRLLNIYLEYSGDYQGLKLLPFYKIYRAVVRAKVNVMRLGEAGLKTGQRRSALDDYHRYMGLAERYTQPLQPFLAIMHGVSGTGKSTVAAEVAAATGALRLRSDVERKRIFGLAPHQDSETCSATDIYTEAATRKTFSRLSRLAGQLLEWGYPVIVDATFLGSQWRASFRQLARTRGVSFAIIDCQAGEKTLQARLEKRSLSAREVSEADTAVMIKQRLRQTPLSEEEAQFTIEVNTEKDLELEEIVEYIAQKKAIEV